MKAGGQYFHVRSGETAVRRHSINQVESNSVVPLRGVFLPCVCTCIILTDSDLKV